MIKKLAVVILNWNGAELLKKFLPSVVEYNDNAISDVIVIDNGSTDSSLEILSKDFGSVKVVKLDNNYGFAGGYNRGLENLDYEYYVLLNSDVEVTENWLTEIIIAFEEDDKLVVAMPKVKDYYNKDYFEYAGASGGFIDKYGYPFCRGRIFDTIEKDAGQYDDSIDVFWASGAAFFIKSKIFNQLGGFDESFFAHMEEIDLCWRIQNLGYKIKCFPSSFVYHAGGSSLPYGSPEKIFLNFRNSYRMLKKNLIRKENRSVLFQRFLLDFLILLKFLLQLKIKSSFSIIKALPELFKKGVEVSNLEKDFVESPILKKSIIFLYLAKRIKCFSQIKEY